MPARVIGADRLGAKLRKLPEAVRVEVDKANRQSADELVRIAKLLHPGSGENKAAIHASDVDDGVLVDFGVKAKVTEELRPFVNPALKVTRKKHSARAKRALKRGVKKAMGGG